VYVSAVHSIRVSRRHLSLWPIQAEMCCVGAAAVADDAPARSISTDGHVCARLRPRDVAWDFHNVHDGMSTRHTDSIQVSVSYDILCRSPVHATVHAMY
jgi:hypothetical protein